LGFFGFFAFFQYFNIITDELFQENLRKAATPAFFLTLISLSISMVLSILSNKVSTVENGLGISSSIAIISFISTVAYLQHKERKGLE
jgi:multisubunit Na+/H+ antiporter MnhF subunit